MDWNFSIGWLILGLLIAGVGTVIIVKYQWIADNLSSGVVVYQKTKLIGLITILIGFIVMTNLHTFLLTALVKIIFKR